MRRVGVVLYSRSVQNQCGKTECASGSQPLWRIAAPPLQLLLQPSQAITVGTSAAPSALPAPRTFSLTHSTKASAGRLCKRRCRDAGSAGQQWAWGRGAGGGGEPGGGMRGALSGGRGGGWQWAWGMVCIVWVSRYTSDAEELWAAHAPAPSIPTHRLPTATAPAPAPWSPSKPGFVGRQPPAAPPLPGRGCAVRPAPCCRGWRTAAHWLPQPPRRRLRRPHHPMQGRM